MTQAAKDVEPILAGELASIENTLSSPLSISLVCDNGSHVDLELLPGQVLGFCAGDANAKLVLHEGDAAGLRVIKPESAS
jgi:hypothetical protein